MGEQRQSQGREDNAASPVEDWEASGVFDTKQKDDAESTGRTDQVAGEDKTFQSDIGGGQHQNVEEALMMQEGGTVNPDKDPKGFQGPGGDPVEGKPQSSTYPS